MIRVVRTRPDCRMVVLGWLFPVNAELDRLLKIALPDAAIVLDSDAPLSVGRAQVSAMIGAARLPASVPVYLIGYSAGCQSVRSVIANQAVTFAGVGLFDGTHDTADVDPKTGKMGRDWVTKLWAKVVKDAAQERISAILTCSSMRYTEGLKPNQDGRAKSTWRVIEDALNEAFGPRPDGTRIELPVEESIDIGKLYIRRSESADTDAPAHRAQLWAGIGIMAAKWGDVVLAEDPTPKPPPEAPAPVPRLGLRLLSWAQGEARDPAAREDPPGSNTGARIRDYFSLAYYRRETGERLRLTAGAWCAAAACYGLAQVVEPGDVLPPPRVAGIELQADAQAILAKLETEHGAPVPFEEMPTGCWVPVARVLSGEIQLQPGWICISKRAGATWFRHVSIVEDRGPGQSFTTVGGNEGDKWGHSQRRLDSGDVLGFVKT